MGIERKYVSHLKYVKKAYGQYFLSLILNIIQSLLPNSTLQINTWGLCTI